MPLLLLLNELLARTCLPVCCSCPAPPPGSPTALRRAAQMLSTSATALRAAEASPPHSARTEAV